MKLKTMATAVMQMTQELKNELDMSQYNFSKAENGKAIFTGRSEIYPILNPFIEDKKLSIQDLIERAEVRKILGLKECEIENKGRESLLKQRSAHKTKIRRGHPASAGTAI